MPTINFKFSRNLFQAAEREAYKIMKCVIKLTTLEIWKMLETKC